MRVESSTTSISWIPSEGMTGHLRLPMDLGITRYDPPPPDRLDDLDELQRSNGFRFANDLRAWIEVEDGRIVDHGHAGVGRMGTTHVHLGRASVRIPGVAFPDLRPVPELGDGWVRFVQTAGGRAGAPLPRRVNRPPYVQIVGPTVWTTLALTLHADGRSEFEVVGASPFPRHWIYDHEGRLGAKSGLMDFTTWSQEHFGDASPWGDHDAPALVTAVESALERELSATIMQRDRRARRRKVAVGDTLVEQGEPGGEVFLLLDGVVSVEVDGEAVTEVGPGAILGERALFEGGRRTATLRALTPLRVAVAEAADLDREALAATAERHR